MTANRSRVKDWGKLMTGFVILPLLIFCSCDDQNNEQDHPKVFFDVKGFIEGQVVSLNKIKPIVSKRMGIGNESSQVSTSEIDWKKELELFVQADINKPAFRTSYTIERPDSVTYSYALKPEQDLPVKFLTIQLDRPRGLPVKIEALLKSENKLYQSEKKITLSLQIKENIASVVSYDILGFQKLAIMEKKPFLIAAVVKN